MLASSRAERLPRQVGASRSRPVARIHPFLFIAPSVLMLVVLLALPITQALLRTFQTDAGWGVENYVRAMRDDHLARLALRHTFTFAFFSVIGQYIIGFVVALLLSGRLPLRPAFRVLFLLPWMFPAVVPGITWRWIFDGLFGVFNEILYRVGFYAETDVPIAWLGQTSTALAATIVANIWRGFPFMMVLLLAGLQSINHEMYEAASVDGANAFRRFWDITLPSMKGISFVAILLAWIGSFMNFAIVQVMTAGGPANSSEVFATLIYKNAFLYADASYAATLGIILLALLMVPGGFYVRATMRSGRG
ncbi:MAG TPA: sugar ABC transporter permease [Thermomicrobiales bacterium]|jgi:multiple sugar transport system permease protein|nr:sugar ABC transporter permease [Thermomicrobiales bacterium]